METLELLKGRSLEQFDSLLKLSNDKIDIELSRLFSLYKNCTPISDRGQIYLSKIISLVAKKLEVKAIWNSENLENIIRDYDLVLTRFSEYKGYCPEELELKIIDRLNEMVLIIESLGLKCHKENNVLINRLGHFNEYNVLGVMWGTHTNLIVVEEHYCLMNDVVCDRRDIDLTKLKYDPFIGISFGDYAGFKHSHSPYRQNFIQESLFFMFEKFGPEITLERREIIAKERLNRSQKDYEIRHPIKTFFKSILD